MRPRPAVSWLSTVVCSGVSFSGGISRIRFIGSSVGSSIQHYLIVDPDRRFMMLAARATGEAFGSPRRENRADGRGVLRHVSRSFARSSPTRTVPADARYSGL